MASVLIQNHHLDSCSHSLALCHSTCHPAGRSRPQASATRLTNKSVFLTGSWKARATPPPSPSAAGAFLSPVHPPPFLPDSFGCLPPSPTPIIPGTAALPLNPDVLARVLASVMSPPGSQMPTLLDLLSIARCFPVVPTHLPRQ